jgi:hypothetical protein
MRKIGDWPCRCGHAERRHGQFGCDSGLCRCRTFEVLPSASPTGDRPRLAPRCAHGIKAPRGCAECDLRAPDCMWAEGGQCSCPAVAPDELLDLEMEDRMGGGLSDAW